MAKIKPLSDKILVKRSEAENTTRGGIVLPDSAKEKPKRGTVRSVGPGKYLEDGSRCPMQVKTGNEVLFNAYGGVEIEVNGEQLLILDESDILAIIE